MPSLATYASQHIEVLELSSFFAKVGRKDKKLKRHRDLGLAFTWCVLIQIARGGVPRRNCFSGQFFLGFLWAHICERFACINFSTSTSEPTPPSNRDLPDNPIKPNSVSTAPEYFQSLSRSIVRISDKLNPTSDRQTSHNGRHFDHRFPVEERGGRPGGLHPARLRPQVRGQDCDNRRDC